MHLSLKVETEIKDRKELVHENDTDPLTDNFGRWLGSMIFRDSNLFNTFTLTDTSGIVRTLSFHQRNNATSTQKAFNNTLDSTTCGVRVFIGDNSGGFSIKRIALNNVVAGPLAFNEPTPTWNTSDGTIVMGLRYNPLASSSASEVGLVASWRTNENLVRNFLLAYDTFPSITQFPPGFNPPFGLHREIIFTWTLRLQET